MLYLCGGSEINVALMLKKELREKDENTRNFTSIEV